MHSLLYLLLFFFDFWLMGICFILTHCSSLSVVSIALDASTVLSKDKQIFYCSVLNQFTIAVKNTFSENFTEIFFIFYIS